MREVIKLPVCAYEVETGDIEVYYDIDELRLIVEEFWDILEEDFKFWDKNGFPLSFEKSFWKEKDNTIIKGIKNEEELLRIHLLKYAEKKGIIVEKSNEISLKDIIDSLKK